MFLWLFEIWISFSLTMQYFSTWPTRSTISRNIECQHDDVTKWKHFPRCWSFVRGIHRSPVDSPLKGQRRGALMFSLICARTNGWADAGDLRRYSAHYDVSVVPRKRCLTNTNKNANSTFCFGHRFIQLSSLWNTTVKIQQQAHSYLFLSKGQVVPFPSNEGPWPDKNVDSVAILCTHQRWNSIHSSDLSYHYTLLLCW